MAGIVLLEDQITVPFLASLAEFRRWVHSENFPERGRIDYIAGQIEIDMSPEELFSHGSLKTEVASVLHARVRKLESGRIFIDSTRITCPSADLSSEPDVVYLSHNTVASGRAILVPKATEEADRYIEIEGAPDLVVEIVSDSSVTKDTKRLPAAYFKAGVDELWLIDARRDPLVFKIHRRNKRSFVAVSPDEDGFQPSLVLGCQYRLDRQRDRHDWPLYELLERS